MSKKILFFLLVLLALIFVYLKNSTVSKNQEIPSPISSPISEKDNTKSLFFQNQQYQFSLFKVNPQNLSLIPNFEAKKNSSDIKTENNCNFLVNAGFYTTESNPVGLFKTGQNLIKDYSPNLTFNGIFSVSFQNLASIESISSENTRLALQSGPILIKNGEIQKLTINNDKEARRVVLGLNHNNEVYFLIIFREDSKYLGPLLEDLPKIVSSLSTSQSLNLADAINLDGGTASAFYSDEISLGELSPIGSAFCIK